MHGIVKIRIRDSNNNTYSLGWYSRHKRKAASIIGFFADRGDMVQPYKYGFNLYEHGSCTDTVVSRIECFEEASAKVE